VHEVSAGSSSPSRINVIADWNDVEAAVLVSTEPIEAAILEQRETPSRWEFDLVTVAAEPASLVAERATGDGPGEAVMIQLTARVSDFGDPARERILLERVRGRLLDLKGVDVRPLR
jgi:hypothetical protein